MLKPSTDPKPVSDVLHQEFLPYTPEQLREHFIGADDEGTDPERHLTKWRARIAEAHFKDTAYLERDETLWTAGALLAVHRADDALERWRSLLELVFGAAPSVAGRRAWSDLISGQVQLFFEVGLRSPEPYRTWLSEHLEERQPIRTQLLASATQGISLESRTHLDAMLLCPETGLAVHFEAKVLSDIATRTKHDALRNQLARNLDCMLLPASNHPVLESRDPELSFLVLLTPELFRRNWRSRLYGHLIREYSSDPSAIQRDLPHLDPGSATRVAQRIGWLTFEEIREIDPDTCCPWLNDAS
jgi:hypothetical protein